MATSNIFEDVAAIAHPWARREDFDDEQLGEMADELYNDAQGDVYRERERFARELEAECRMEREQNDGEASEEDVLLRELGRASDEIKQAQERLRRLIAYGREFQGRRPFPLSWLARASGMSISGVRTAYQRSDVEFVAEQLDVPVPPETNPAPVD